MAQLQIVGIQYSMPIIRIDGKDYFIMGGTYQRLYYEQTITERYTNEAVLERQFANTYYSRWKMTLLVPTEKAEITILGGESLDIGLLDDLHQSAESSDMVEFYDIDCWEQFSPSYIHYVYLNLDWEQPAFNDVSLWQVPVELWGR